MRRILSIQRIPFKPFGGVDGARTRDPGVTGRYSNQLNYHSSGMVLMPSYDIQAQARPSCESLRPLGDSEPRNHRERVVS